MSRLYIRHEPPQVGARFSRLQVVGVGNPIHQVVRGRSAAQIVPTSDCRCDCGALVRVRNWDLMNGNTKSCGCLKREILSARVSLPDPEEASKRGLYYSYKRRARTDKLDFDLDEATFRKLTTSPCHYCGILPHREFVQKGARKGTPYNGIDRKDNSQGYVPENAVPCCATCNYMKKAMSDTQFIEHVRKIVRKAG